MQTMTATSTPRRLKTIAAMPAAVAAAVLVGDLVSMVIARMAHGAGVSQSFAPLHFATYTSLIVLGVIGGAVGWQLLRTRATYPRRLLARLVPLVLLLSFVPDVLMGITKAETGTTWGGVLALMAMHIVVASAAVGSYLHFLPVRPADGRPQADTKG
jgi:H+/Cl- antiporter ClcA